MPRQGKKKSGPEKDPGAGNIDQIRDILVGPFQREQAARVDQLERTVDRHSTEAAEATAKVQKRLEKQIADAVESLSGKVSELSASTTESDEGLKKQLDALGTDVEKKVGALQAKLTEEVEGLEKATAEHLVKLRSELEIEVARLREQKAGREDLGDYLIELGLRLKGDESLQMVERSAKGARGAGAHS